MKTTLALAIAALVASPLGALAQNNDGRCFDKGTLRYVDCPRPAPVAAVPPPAPVLAPPPPLWTGAYVGAHAGYAWGDFDGTYSGLGAPLDYGALDADGPLIGGQIGYNHQFENNVVLGVEGDFSWLFNADDSASNSGVGIPGAAATTFANSISADLDWLASARLRAGYAADNIMPYITGGVALAGYEIGASSSTGAGFSTSGTTDETAIGGVVGGGIEYLASENIVLRVEGLYYMFDDDEGIGGLTAASGAGDKAGLDDVIVGRVGISYKF